MIRGIFFDANGVLYHRPEPPSHYATSLLRLHGYSYGLPAEDAASLQSLEARAMIGSETPEEYWDQFLLRHGVANSGERVSLVRQIMRQVDRVVPRPEAAEVLSVLKRRGFFIGVITNTMYLLEWKQRWLARARLTHVIDVISSSAVVGASKPDRAIYLDALARTRLEPPEGAFVGHDGIELDGARSLGMVTVAVNHDESVAADYAVASLVDLLTLPVFMRTR